jgi:hypothetical protein
MAQLNIFKTVTAVLTTSPATLYTARPGYAGIILMAQVSNITASTKTVTFSHYNPITTTATELLSGFSIPPNDAVSATTGKLVLEIGQSVTAFASANSSVKVVLSILETSSDG